jgi:2-C-methyl-D-erythritol 4-phosphate cytidylyltransferase
MGINRPKQYLPLRGRTILEWSLAPFLDHDQIDGVVLVLAKSDQEYSKLPIARHPKIVTTHGGVARADSVRAGLEVFVMVHDAARPCVEWDDIERLREEADDEHGGLLALPVTDTLKKSKQGKVSSTVDRAFIWRAQTPQIFRLDLLANSLKECAERGFEVTDEASAMERAGYTPRLVRGRDSNIKVTYAEDLAVAEFWLARQEQQP